MGGAAEDISRYRSEGHRRHRRRTPKADGVSVAAPFGCLGSPFHAGGLRCHRQDEPRNNLIFDDVLKALEAKRSPVVLTERRDHLEYLQKHFRASCAISLSFGAGCLPANKAAEAALRVADNQERLSLPRGAILERASTIKGSTRYS